MRYFWRRLAILPVILGALIGGVLAQRVIRPRGQPAGVAVTLPIPAGSTERALQAIAADRAADLSYQGVTVYRRDDCGPESAQLHDRLAATLNRVGLVPAAREIRFAWPWAIEPDTVLTGWSCTIQRADPLGDDRWTVTMTARPMLADPDGSALRTHDRWLETYRVQPGGAVVFQGGRELDPAPPRDLIR
jgi:hypothetical protein